MKRKKKPTNEELLICRCGKIAEGEIEDIDCDCDMYEPEWVLGIELKKAYDHSSLKFKWRKPFSQMTRGQLKTIRKIVTIKESYEDERLQ